MTYISVSDSTAGASTVGYNITTSPGTDTYTRSWKTPAEGVMISSDYNGLYVVGCNVEVYMFGDNMTDLVGACMSTCIDNTETMERAGRYCVGIGCCYISFSPREMPAFMINLVRHNSTRAQQDKALSEVKIFLLEEYRFVVSDLFSSWVNTSNAYPDTSSIFHFAITDQPNCERAQLNKDSYACNDESNCYDLPSARGYDCFCPNSQGNPYVVDGCIQGLYRPPSFSLLLIHDSAYTYLDLNADEEKLLSLCCQFKYVMILFHKFERRNPPVYLPAIFIIIHNL